MNSLLKQITATLPLLMCSLLVTSFSLAQADSAEPPKLVVGIVVDQMSFEQLYKYQDKYSAGGFARLLKGGFNYKNTQYNYLPTVTAAGHSSIYTGTTPATHGIIGNSWFQRNENTELGNVDDPKERIIGSVEENTNGLSPRNLLSTTITDQLRLATNFKSKVISVSLKDRGAILPGGHLANAAYWHDWQLSPGYFVSSSYYMDKLPDWVSRFNKEERSDAYLDINWNTLHPIDSYTESAPDNNPYERSLRTKESPTFPYEFSKMREEYKSLGAEYQLIWVSPYGNTLLTEFALEAIKKEGLGKDKHTDLINISYSVPDVIGHTFGPQSVELEDIYLRLDEDIANLLSSLDQLVGVDNYTLFLTSDHGAIPTASYLQAKGVPTGVAALSTYTDSLANYMNRKYGKQDWIQNFNYEQVYLQRALIEAQNLDLGAVQEDAASYLATLKWIRYALPGHNLSNQNYSDGMRQRIQNGFHPKRSGDIVLALEPGIIMNADPVEVSEIQGTTHGSGYSYDTHVPLVWYGKNIPKGASVRQVTITDIAPSLAMLLNLQLPSGNTGMALEELFE